MEILETKYSTAAQLAIRVLEYGLKSSEMQRALKSSSLLLMFAAQDLILQRDFLRWSSVWRILLTALRITDPEHKSNESFWQNRQRKHFKPNLTSSPAHGKLFRHVTSSRGAT